MSLAREAQASISHNHHRSGEPIIDIVVWSEHETSITTGVYDVSSSVTPEVIPDFDGDDLRPFKPVRIAAFQYLFLFTYCFP